MASGKGRSKQASRSRPRAGAGTAQPPRSAPKRRPAGASKSAPPARSGPAALEGLPTTLLGGGLIIGLYAMMPAFIVGSIHLHKSTEVVDHVVPGILVLALVLAAIVRRAQPDTLMLGAGVGILLAGFWMVLTHIGLARQALDNEVSKTTALYHCSTALLTAALGVAWVYRYRAAAADNPPAQAQARRRA